MFSRSRTTGPPMTEPNIKSPNAWLDPANLNYTRALTLMALGAIAGLVLAAIGLFTAKGTSTLVVPPEDVALVNQQPIVRSDYLAQLSALYDTDFSHATPEQRKTVLDDMIREELFVQRGTELDVAAADPTVRTDMVSAVEQQSATDAMTQLPNDDKLLAYYQAHKERYSTEGYMQLDDLVFPKVTADAVLAQARMLPPAQAIARLGAKENSKAIGNEFYFAARVDLGDRLAGIAEGLNDGAVSGPVALPDGLHILYMTKNVKPVLLNFYNAKPKVLEDYRRDAVQRMTVHEQDFLRERANILIAKDAQ
jgi:hypothetical protein